MKKGDNTFKIQGFTEDQDFPGVTADDYSAMAISNVRLIRVPADSTDNYIKNGDFSDNSLQPQLFWDRMDVIPGWETPG